MHDQSDVTRAKRPSTAPTLLLPGCLQKSAQFLGNVEALHNRKMAELGAEVANANASLVAAGRERQAALSDLRREQECTRKLEAQLRGAQGQIVQLQSELEGARRPAPVEVDRRVRGQMRPAPVAAVRACIGAVFVMRKHAISQLIVLCNSSTGPQYPAYADTQAFVNSFIAFCMYHVDSTVYCAFGT